MLTRASLLQMWGGIILVNTGSHVVWIDFTVPLIILIALLSSDFRVCQSHVCAVDPHEGSIFSCAIHNSRCSCPERFCISSPSCTCKLLNKIHRVFTFLEVFSMCFWKDNVRSYVIPKYFRVKLWVSC